MTKVYDKDGNILKAGAVVVREVDEDREVLLIEHKKGEYYNFPKGHLKDGEDSEVCTKRELKEETGYDIKILKALPENKYNTWPENEPVLLKMYLAELTGLQATASDKETYIWAKKEEVDRLLALGLGKHLKYWQSIRGLI